MFNVLTKILKKNDENINKTIEYTPIIFQDVKTQNIEISILDVGTDEVLIIKELQSGAELVLDAEKSLLLSMILNEYATTGKITKMLNTIKEGE